MPRPATVPSIGVRKQIPIKLASDAAIDLIAFCEAHYGARQNVVIEQALSRFIQDGLASDLSLKDRFDQAKERLLRSQQTASQADALRLVRPGDEVGH